VEPATHWVKSRTERRPRASRTKLAELSALPQAKVLHGVGYPVGGTISDRDEHVPAFRAWAGALAAPWVSEHLSVFQAQGPTGPRCLGFLMPPVQSEAGVGLACANIRARRDLVGRPFAFETGVNYFPMHAWEMPDDAFFAAVAEEAGCGVLLDLNNLWCNEKNGRARVRDVVAALPPDAIWEVHLARAEPLDGVWLDAHSGAIDPELAALAADIVPDLPNVGAIVFEVSPDRLPGFTEADLLRQMETVNALWEAAGTGRSAPLVRRRPRTMQDAEPPTPLQWEAGLVRGLGEPGAAGRAADAFGLYARLITAFRKGAVSDLLSKSLVLMLRELGETGFDALFDRYAAAFPPCLFPNEEARAFAAFALAHAPPVTGLPDLLTFESALVTAIADGTSLRIDLERDIEVLLTTLAAGRSLAEVPAAPCALEVTGLPRPGVRRIGPSPPRSPSDGSDDGTRPSTL
jgi:uncharacterized protein (UPF0276 family)